MHTEPGGKLQNEDFIIAKAHPRFPEGYVCLLADGQGGQANGAMAARTACETAWRLAASNPFADLLNPDAWTAILAATDTAVAASGGYTTLIGFAAGGNFICGASCGDSKVYIKNKTGKIEEITERQRKNPPVGSGEAIFETYLADIANGSRLLVVSDGVWKYCGYEAIQKVFESADYSAAPVELRDATASRSGGKLPDDFSVIAIMLPP